MNGEAAAPTLECVRHGEIRPPMPPPVLVRDLWRCPCGQALVLPSVAKACRDRMGAYLRV